MKKTLLPLILLLFILALFHSSRAQAQEQELRLRINKIFGYSGFGYGELQGVMRLTASGPETLLRVVFLIDEQPMAEDSEAPFEIRFDTGSYPLGNHTLSATGYTRDGQAIASNRILTEFMTAERGMQRGLQIAGPLLAIVFLIMVLSFVLPLAMSRGKKLELPLGAERRYGLAGGAICPRCKRPFPLHWFSPNMGPTLKVDRCPFCGRWGLLRRRSLSELRTAEAVELELAQAADQVSTASAEEKLHKKLDDSRYQDL